ncbi:MAG: LPXTG cell wall anchor domain-containing protein, partial [Chloroflexi bacterium]|nr:LPXTG cell wall anchor domain-containing protein [Chloroflexota bacterium]
EPQAAKIIDFSVAVPADTAHGEYITALVAENVEPYVGSEGTGVALEQVNRTVVAVAINVPGPRRPALEIGAAGHKAAAGSSFVTFEVFNPGNVHLKPSGEFLLREAGGAELATAPAVMDSVYADRDTLFEAPLTAALEAGDYCAELSLTDEETGVTDSTECLPFTVQPPPSEAPAPGGGSTTIPVIQPAIDVVTGNPLPPALGAAVLLALLGGAWFLWRRRRRRLRPQPG